MTTALVTGATAGLGAAFARALAAERRDLVLVARDAERLSATASDLRDRFSVDVEVLPADLASVDGCELVEKRLADASRPVELLVNNAGIGLRDAFLENPIEDEERMLALNVRAVMRLTHAAVPGMVTRGHGDVLNVASVAGFGVTAPGSTYSATKAWVITFSESVHLTLRQHGVRVSAVCPGFVRTEFHSRAAIPTENIPDVLWLDADDVVRDALADLRRGRPTSVSSVRYKVLGGIVRYAPRPVFLRLIGRAARTVGR
ncbi:SDR family NAD(P)-dependent oxidoreductase [Cryptosporangium phraense]|uniref:SDR family oxidoreductase n=1 Tax=Cryptosporangium phraense TaxID=2593070 RepID=A0A545AI64_9ACTN|nr:SDR family oxidoreductase [Cryptosporangium phraense]TQS41003.1 SDR family oxidoreductase [Cryptosporangium phraense]